MVKNFGSDIGHDELESPDPAPALPAPPPWGSSAPPPGAAEPPPGWALPVGPTAPAPPWNPATNGLAIASLILGLLAVVPLGVIFGIVALRQIARTGEQGRGLAIGGLIASGVWTVLLILVSLAALLTSQPAEPEVSAEVGAVRQIPIEELRVGDCLTNLVEDAVAFTVSTAPCSQPHEGQVYALVDLPDGTWPGERRVQTLADAACQEALASGFPHVFEDTATELFLFHPTHGSWRQGDRSVTCIVAYLDGPRTGSVLD